ncbi:hypothetical protein F4780DRAFT_781118 [Xylariomycetidae sp. FL0641]|nr:hypothetical protein F4780DRAFT_781118 [Xylariomycetidae sp. FL0641]
MGRPLFIAPVESDIPSKPAAKSPAAAGNARSPIRRNERARFTDDHQRRMIALLRRRPTAQANASILSRDSAPPSPPEAVHEAIRVRPRPADDIRLSDFRRDLQSPNRRPSGSRPHSSEAARVQAEYTELFSGLRDEVDFFGRTGPGSDDFLRPIPNFGPRRISPRASATRLSVPRDRRQLHMRSESDADIDGLTTQPASRQSASARSTPFIADSPPPLLSEGSTNPARRFVQERLVAILSSPTGRDHVRNRARHLEARGIRTRPLDGLGDRDRSLSPEGDGVWDTLQSTLTPDPQPPSVGSSFASTGAQSTAALSSNTSITNPDDDAEPPCDPVSDNSDDEDEGVGRAQDRRRRDSSRRPTPHLRSYADVAAESRSGQLSPEEAENPDIDRHWLSGMHRIVAGLASREDIPDEWWAEAGLSRSMSWEESTD